MVGPVLRCNGLDTIKLWSYSGPQTQRQYYRGMHKEQRGLRFDFTAEAEVRPERSPAATRGRVKQLSLRGCFVAAAGSFAEHERVRVKIFNGDDCLESLADVIYVRPDGLGLLFADMTPDVRGVLQKWVLTALDHQTEEVTAG